MASDAPELTGGGGAIAAPTLPQLEVFLEQEWRSARIGVRKRIRRWGRGHYPGRAEADILGIDCRAVWGYWLAAVVAARTEHAKEYEEDATAPLTAGGDPATVDG